MKHALAVLIVCVVAASASADDLRMVPIFRYGSPSSSAGGANLVAADLDGDGDREIIGCSGGAPYALEWTGTGYSVMWQGPSAGCRAVAAGDRDGDGTIEVIVTTAAAAGNAPGRLLIFDPRGLATARAGVTLPGTAAGADVAIGNVDNDAAAEIVVVTSAATYVYDAATLNLEWTASGYGGKNVAIADVDGNTAKEIVVNGSTGAVLDGAAHTLKWGYVGGFGLYMAVGNVDNDAKDEICFVTNGNGMTINILNGDTFTTSTVPSSGYHPNYTIAIGDGNNDGVNEIIGGNEDGSTISGRRPSDGAIVWSVTSFLSPSAALLADVDGDGKSELIWRYANYSDGALSVADPVQNTIDWTSATSTGVFAGAVADLDNDGNPEIISAPIYSYGYPPVIEIFDARTHVKKGSITAQLNGTSLDISRVAVGQLDADPAKEIVVLSGASYGRIVVWDGVTLQQEWANTLPAAYDAPQITTTAFAVANVDNDATDEILVGQSDAKLLVLNGASSVIQHLEPLDGVVVDLAVTDFENDGKLDLVVGTTAGVQVFNTSTWASRGEVAMPNVYRVAASPAGIAVIAAPTYYSTREVHYYATPAMVETWSCGDAPAYQASSLAFADLNGNPRLLVGTLDGTLLMAPLDGTTCPEFSSREVTAAAVLGVRRLTVVDATKDGRPELLMDTDTGTELALIGSSDITRGDCNEDGAATLDDIEAATAFLWGHPGTSPAADFDADERISAEDVFQLISYRYAGGAAPQP
ncbi:MAG TPA: VCBS repeat-containing protein [Thermoanaerobaculia bacterium]|nr:VCBS repeat-containing protein [Thermoanaerobaculia bacterium]